MSRYEPVTGTAFAGLNLEPWRWALGMVFAEFRCASFAQAAELAAAIATEADQVDHHPDLHLRYPGVVRVGLATHAIGTTSTADVDLARSINVIADGHGAIPQPPSLARVEIAIDTLDVAAIRPFWAAITGFDPAGDDALVDPTRLEPTIWFQQMDEPRTERNRMHLDVTVNPADVDVRIQAALQAGGVLVSDQAAPRFWIMADPEGNEACLCTWQGRDP